MIVGSSLRLKKNWGTLESLGKTRVFSKGVIPKQKSNLNGIFINASLSTWKSKRYRCYFSKCVLQLGRECRSLGVHAFDVLSQRVQSCPGIKLVAPSVFYQFSIPKWSFYCHVKRLGSFIMLIPRFYTKFTRLLRRLRFRTFCYVLYFFIIISD